MLTRNLRIYGRQPFRVAVVHGGPGARGEMAPVARELAATWGVLEPLQTATTLEGQVEELREIVQEGGDVSLTLIGFSWGAWLSFIVAARYPALVQKLILVGSGPYEQRYVEQIQATRLNRLDVGELAEYESIMALLSDPSAEGKAAAFARLGALAAKTDRFDPLPEEGETAGRQDNRFHGVLQEAVEMRRSGELLGLAGRIACPVVAIHGDYDPHPAEGVKEPLAEAVADFRWVLLERCGHKPWIERQARTKFFEVLREALR